MPKARRPKFLDEIPSVPPRAAIRPFREEKYHRPAGMHPEGAPVTEERILNAMMGCAFVMLTREDGHKIGCIWRKLEEELAILRQNLPAVERARSFRNSFDPHEVAKILYIDSAKLPV